MFRSAFLFQILIVILDLRVLLHLEGNRTNIIVKAVMLGTGALFLFTRPVQRGVVALMAAMVGVALLCALGTDFRGFEWIRFVGGAVSLVMPFLFLAAEPTPEDRALVLRALAVMPVAMVGLGVVYSAIGLSTLFQEDATLHAIRLAGSDIPAYLGAAGFVGCFAALQLAEKRHFGYVVLFLCDAGITVLTGARMAIALAVMLCGAVYLLNFKRFPLVKFFAPAYLLGASAVFLVFFGEGTIRRFQSGSFKGRDLLWSTLTTQLDAHPWFGVGLGNQLLLIPMRLTQKTGTIAGHDEYLRIAVELGYVGAAAVFILALVIFYKVWNTPWVRRDPTFAAAAASFLIYCLSDNAFGVPEIFLILTAASFANRGRSVEPAALPERPMPASRPLAAAAPHGAESG